MRSLLAIGVALALAACATSKPYELCDAPDCGAPVNIVLVD